MDSIQPPAPPNPNANANANVNNGGRGSFSTLLLITFVIFMLSGGSDDIGMRLEVENAVTSMRHQLSNYTAWLNHTETNFTLTPDPPALFSLVEAIVPTPPPLDPSLSSYFSNITGFLSGSISIYNLSTPHFHTPTSPESSPASISVIDSESDDYLPGPPKQWAKLAESYADGLNITDAAIRTSGWKRWRETTKTLSNVKEYTVPGFDLGSFFYGTLDLTAVGGDIALKVDFEGVHVHSTGLFIAVMDVPSREAPLLQLSAHVPERLAGLRNATAWAVGEEWKRRLGRMEERYAMGPAQAKEQGALEVSDNGSAGDVDCPFTLFAQLRASPISVPAMEEYEHELMDPTGIRTARPPPAILDGVLVSKECALLVVVDGAEALQTDVFWRKATNYASIAFIIYFGLLIAMVNQMEWTSSPASISKLSRWTFAMQAIIDSYAFVAHMTVGIVSNNRASASLIAPGFLAASLCLVFEVRYSILMHRIQAPEDAAARPPPPPPAAPGPVPTTPGQRAASAALSRFETQPASQDHQRAHDHTHDVNGDVEDVEAQNPTSAEPPSANLAAPATATRDRLVGGRFIPGTPGPAQPSTIRQIITVVSNPESKAWVFTALLLLSLFQIILTSKVLMAALVSLHSFWVPQIVRNVKKGTRKALRKRYVFAMTLGRSFFLLYALACPKNVLFSEPNQGVWLIVAWLFFQVLVLIGQEYLGSAFFLPKSWEQKKLYDYQVAIPTPDAEAPDESALGDCSVCLEPILAPRPDLSGLGLGASEKEAEAAVAPLLGPRSYSLAPCNHKFHTPCLERWLTIKSICPVCRRHLPPL